MQRPEARRAPLIPDFLSPWTGALLVVLAGIAGIFAIMTRGEVGAWPLEYRVMNWLQDSDVPHRLFRVGAELGAPGFFAVIVLVLAVLAVARRSWPALIACAAVPGAVLLVEAILKPMVDRRAAWTDILIYPSGTAAGVAAWATLLWLLVVPIIRRADLRIALTVGLAGLVGLTAISVVALGRHYPIDAVGGVATGMGVVLACAALIDLVTGARRPDEETSPGRRTMVRVSRD